MPDDACRLPATPENDDDETIRRMLSGRRIAVVGLSDDPYRASHGVAAYLRSAGYDIIPVNPTHRTVMGLASYPSLAEVPGDIDVVNVFRRPEYCADIVRDAIAIGATGVWLQQGIESEEAEELAREAGIDFVQDRCIKVEHMYRQ